MERWTGRVALVTGASVGIGAAVARALVQHGMKVVGCARSVDKIEGVFRSSFQIGFQSFEEHLSSPITNLLALAGEWRC